MNSKQFKILASFLMIAFLFSISSSGLSAGKPALTNGQADITTSQGTISVNGNQNVPFFQIKLNGSNTAYLVKFMSIEEFNDSNNDGKVQSNELLATSLNSLPSMSWTFSSFKTTNDTNGAVTKVDFNITSSSSSPSIQLRIHIDYSQGNSMKFDLVISNYSWKVTSNTEKLAVKFQIAGGNLTTTSNKNEVQFGNAKFSTVSSASTSSGDVNVATQIDSGSTVYLLVDHFTGGFELDPTLTVSSSGSSPGFEILPLMIGFAVIGLVYAKKRSLK